MGQLLLWRLILIPVLLTLPTFFRTWSHLATSHHLEAATTAFFAWTCCALAYLVVLLSMDAGVTAAMGPAIWLTFVELAVVTAIAILFGSFTSPVLSALFTVGLTLIGKMSQDLQLLGEKSESGLVRAFTDVAYRVLPDLSRFDLRNEASYGVDVEWEYVAYATGYGAAYAAALLVVASIIFRFRDFK